MKPVTSCVHNEPVGLPRGKLQDEGFQCILRTHLAGANFPERAKPRCN